MARSQQRSLDDFVYAADSLEELYSIGAKVKANVAADVQSSGSVGSKDQPSGATPTSIPIEEIETDPIPELIRKNALKRQREEAIPDPAPGTKKVATEKETAQPRIKIIHPNPVHKAPSSAPIDAAKGKGSVPKVVGDKAIEVEKHVKKTEEVEKPLFERVEKVVQVEEPVVEQAVPIEPEKSRQIVEEPAQEVHEEGNVATQDVETKV
ncbi:uncharacterized protein LOC110924554 [Helianthus annuus]|uniref:uncharacterized protein LOC110924554 n=1 Tax=Helianthus annuus TaxID=4232 RepID=UPI000B8F263A|nr:uncharacterized protein LOC110924554 [Helianthus annuus]